MAGKAKVSPEQQTQKPKGINQHPGYGRPDVVAPASRMGINTCDAGEHNKADCDHCDGCCYRGERVACQ
ncbi:hypothetical protein [Photobacterium frigidiphilum]|uniref:hypothetical protein n=1 Tax=Photobacterium frigidiphilum TaxID=264736 RepID=UPI0011B23A8F|nr:hypothetical protein [Photobacterium frigidiphilum]